MSSFQELSSDEQAALDAWLQSYEIPLTYRDGQQLCDALKVARMFNRILPGLVDLTSYTPCLSLPLNFLNWQIFNQQVLRKLDMGLPLEDLEKMGQGCVKTIDLLLHTLMTNESRLKQKEV
ncbi:uncharacterized protein LOC111065399 [Drosophila obscura]|uniref:uncharacterized protein LOC111065399 n=1 Tax=Drosophila obscura TaxID=7282 RepID=UPI000BA0E163|nr:uncharacterized protein LOC111065399 [Drosophila obscura]